MGIQSNTRAWRNGIGAILLAIFQIVPWTSFSLYLRPLSESLGVDVGSVSLIFSLSAVGGLVTALSVGKLLKKVDTRIIIAIGGITLAVFLITVSVSKSIVLIYIVSVLHGFGGVAAGFTMAQIVITQWFDKIRGTMLGVCSMGLSISAGILIPVLGTFLERYGYKTTALWEGVIAGGLVILVGIFLISGPPEKYGLNPHGYVERSLDAPGAIASQERRASFSFGQIMTFPVFWVVMLCIFMATMATQSFNSQGASYFQSIGLDSVQASYALSVFALAGIPWSLLFGIVSDKISPTVAALINGGVAAIAYLLSFIWTGWMGAIVVAVCFAAAGSVTGMLGPTLMAKLFGTKEAGSLVGFVRAGSSVGSMVGAPLAGFLFASSGSYTTCFTVMGVLLVVVLILNVWAGSKKTVTRIREKQAALQMQATD